MARGKYKKKRENQESNAVSIEMIGLPPRIIGILKAHSITTLSDVAALDKKELLVLPGIGDISANTILERVAQYSGEEQ